MTNSITDEGIDKLLKDAHFAYSDAEKTTSGQERMAYATMSIACSNLIIAEMLIRHDNNRNCRCDQNGYVQLKTNL
jgi:hypothetical protein